MMKKRSLVLVAFLAVAVSGQAAVISWIGTGDSAWSTGANWTGGVVPGGADHVLLNNSVGPAIISSTVGNVDILAPGWSLDGSVNIVDGGSIGVNGFTRLGHDPAQLGTINMTGGSLLTPILHVGFNGNGIINLSGTAVLEVAGDLGFGEEFATGGTGVINMDGDAQFLYLGDWTAARAQSIINSGFVQAVNVGDSIAYSYNAGTGNTEFTVIPEPSTLALVGLLGSGIIFGRRHFVI